MKMQSHIQSRICCLSFLVLLISLLSIGQASGQSLAVMKEVRHHPVETLPLAPKEGEAQKAGSPYWRAFIWEAIPPESLGDSSRSQIMEAYQQNDWRPFFIGSRFELNEKAKVLLARLQKVQDDALDPAPYFMDALQKTILNLEQLRYSLTNIDPGFQDSLAEFHDKESAEAPYSTSQNPASLQLASNSPQTPLPDPTLRKEKEQKYREIFKAASELDLHLAYNLARFASEMHPYSRNKQVQALSGEIPMAEFLKGLEPPSPKYENLQKALRTYTDLASRGIQQPVIGNLRFKLGDAGEAVRTLQRRLQQEGYYGERISGVFDLATQTAVKEFQKVHVLEDDGTVGQRTREWLNVTYREKAGMIASAMIQLRKSETRQHDRYVRINIPQFILEYYKDGRVQAVHRVIVGKASGKKIKSQGKWIGENHTPPISSAIDQVVINPRWYVSDRIRLELNGEAGDDPTYFSRHGYVQMSSAYPWGEPRLFLPPGPTNPLGRVVFQFPNPYAVFLHDTPKRQLFQRVRRDLSHGCIRVERAQELAQMLLTDDQNPAAQKTEGYFAATKQVYIRLTQPVPIVIEYHPVSFDGNNHVVFCGDPYNWLQDSAHRNS